MHYNPYTTGCPPLERALKAWHDHREPENAELVVTAVSRALQEHVEVLIPLMRTNEEELAHNPMAEPEYAERILTKPDGSAWLPLFTNRTESEELGAVTLSPMPLRDLLELLVDSQLTGIVLNPFGAYLEIPKDFGQELLYQPPLPRDTAAEDVPASMSADEQTQSAERTQTEQSGAESRDMGAPIPANVQEMAEKNVPAQKEEAITEASADNITGSYTEPVSKPEEKEDRFAELTREMTAFIAANPTCFHVVQAIRERLTRVGYTELREQNRWELRPGKGYFTVRGGSSVIAFRVPERSVANFQIVASHSDSPSFKVKEKPELGKPGGYVTLNVEKYGGMLLAPWFDRPLSVAGRVLVEKNGILETRLVNLDRDLLMLPSLAVHMDRSANDGHSYSVQKEIAPILGDERAKDGLLPLVAEAVRVPAEKIVSSDLFLYARTPASVWGANREYVSSPRLDDQMCVFASLQAFLQGGNPHSVTVMAVFDNEEVGSLTKQGADSTFLEDVLERVSACLGLSTEEHRMAVASSFMLSADNGHAIHPNYPEKADLSNRPVMNGGVLLKYNANQKYTTDAVSAAVFQSLCRRAGVPFQTYVNHSDVAGGSTLGNLSSAHVSLNTVDIGAAQLAMHSPYETAGVRDTGYLTAAMAAFYTTHIRLTDTGVELL